jgi:hypothetical protein
VPTDQPSVLHDVQRAAASGDLRALLLALRHKIAAAIDEESTAPRDLVPLSRALTALAGELATLDAADDLAAAVGDEPWRPDLL